MTGFFRHSVSVIAIAAAVCAFSLASPAFAHEVSGTKHAQGAPNDHVEARIKTLHDKLKITSAQEGEWKKVAAAMRWNEGNLHKLVEARHAEESATAVDDLQSYEKIASAHATGLKKLIPAFQALYNTMSPDQKENADGVFGRFEGHEHRRKASDNAPPNQSK